MRRDYIWISGEFESIEAPRRLVYIWSVEPSAGPPERITVQFEPRDCATEVIVRHDRIPDVATRKSHEAGWLGVLMVLWIMPRERHRELHWE